MAFGHDGLWPGDSAMMPRLDGRSWMVTRCATFGHSGPIHGDIEPECDSLSDSKASWRHSKRLFDKMAIRYATPDRMATA